MRKLLLLVVVTLALCVADARRNRGNNRRDRGRDRGRERGSRVRGLPATAQNVSIWNRQLSGSESMMAKEFSFTLPESADQVFVMSSDKRKLKMAGFKKSQMIYDFTNEVSMVILKVKKTCYKMDEPEDLTREGVLQDMAALNGTTRNATAMVQMYTVELIPDVVEDIRRRPVLDDLCSKTIKTLTTTPPEGVSSRRKILKVTTKDHLMSITNVKRRGRRQ